MMCGTVGFANASVKDLPMLTVDGKKYYHYEVTSKETLYTICKKLGVTKDEVVKYNPKVADGLRAGTVLVFPVDAMNPQAVQALRLPGASSMVSQSCRIMSSADRPSMVLPRTMGLRPMSLSVRIPLWPTGLRPVRHSI